MLLFGRKTVSSFSLFEDLEETFPQMFIFGFIFICNIFVLLYFVFQTHQNACMSQQSWYNMNIMNNHVNIWLKGNHKIENKIMNELDLKRRRKKKI